MSTDKAVLSTFSYASLVKQKLIPDLMKIMTGNLSGVSVKALALAIKRYPTAVYKNNSQEEFNMQMSFDIKKAVQNLSSPADPVAPQWLEREWNSFDILSGNSSISISVPISNKDNLQELITQLKPIDIKTDKCLLNIKTASSFKKLFEMACIEILTQYAFTAGSAGSNSATHVGFILPLQQEILLCNVQKWNYSKYLHFLEEHHSPNNQISLMLSPQVFHHNKVGSHIAQGDNIIQTFTEYYREFPCQMFITNPQSGKRSADTTRLYVNNPATADIIRKNKLLYFTHSPYVINLCSAESGARAGEDIPFGVRILIDDIIGTVKMGGKGVVVHIGVQKDLTLDQALQNMEDNVRKALAYATKECPLLLETPCGEGTEICTTVEELIEFYKRFSEEEQGKLGICVDTCHVFAAGYDPLDYLQRISAGSRGDPSSIVTTSDRGVGDPSSIVKLIHFNDSRGDFGSHVDRHQVPGKGKIGIVKMLKIMEWAVAHSIPMVRE